MNRARTACVSVLLAAPLFAALPAVGAQAACTELAWPNLALMENRSGGGAQYQLTASDPDLHDTNLYGGFNFNDKASRVKNSYNCTAWVLYDDVNYSDRRYCIRPRQEVDLHDSRWNFGDKISSVRKLSTSSCSGYPTFG